MVRELRGLVGCGWREWGGGGLGDGGGGVVPGWGPYTTVAQIQNQPNYSLTLSSQS